MSEQTDVKPVFGLADLQAAAPIFRHRWAIPLARRLMAEDAEISEPQAQEGGAL